MNVQETALPGVLLIEPRVFGDDRGAFLESWQRERYVAAGIDAAFVQDNHSRSTYGVVRGLHYQLHHPQGKLVRVARGRVLDVAVDIRRGSPTFGQWTGAVLDDESHRQLWLPPGFAHGFAVLSPTADFLYKCTDFYHPEDERTVLWNDPDLGIDWQVAEPILSQRDLAAVRLADMPAEELPALGDAGP